MNKPTDETIPLRLRGENEVAMTEQEIRDALGSLSGEHPVWRALRQVTREAVVDEVAVMMCRVGVTPSEREMASGGVGALNDLWRRLEELSGMGG